MRYFCVSHPEQCSWQHHLRRKNYEHAYVCLFVCLFVYLFYLLGAYFYVHISCKLSEDETAKSNAAGFPSIQLAARM